MNADTVKKRIASRLSIPSLPTVLQRIEELLQDPNVGTRDVGSLIGQDPPLAAKVLRIANSSYYGLREPAVTIEHAASVLGLNALRNMLLEATMFKAWAHLEGNDTVDLAELWKHSILTGHLASRLTRMVVGLQVSKEEMYAAGLLHDIGRLALLDTFPRETLEAIQRSRETGEPLHVCEQALIGLDHAQAGGVIAKRWALPKPVAFAILHHHQLAGNDRERAVVAVVDVANKLAHLITEGRIGTSSAWISPTPLKLLGLDLDDALELGAEFVERLAEIEL